MPKRKRPTYESNGDRVLEFQKKEVADKIIYSKKLLHRALKTAKGFERQKLGKRLRRASEENQSEDVKKLNGEIEALKGLDLDKTTETQLRHSLLKVKAFAESELLPEDVKKEVEKPLVGEGYRKTLHDITSRLVNMKPVKDTMSQIMNGMYIVLGIPAPVPQKGTKGKKKEPLKGILKDSTTSTKPKNVERMVSETAEVGDMVWTGFDSDQGSLKKSLKFEQDAEDESSNAEEMDEKTTSRYEALLGGSSDEESFDEEAYKTNKPSKAPTRQPLLVSPSPSSFPDDPDSQSSPSPPPQKALKKPKTLKELPRASTFLPSLMSSYWSGSEDSASDISDSESKPVRKNRPGQMARRAIWEKKFGTKANHIKSGAGPVGQKKNDGWDAKRGATDGNRGRGRGRDIRRSNGRQRDFSKVTGESSMPVGKRGAGKNDDAGVLHPSWQAAKKAKMEQKKATFEGKKVVFD